MANNDLCMYVYTIIHYMYYINLLVYVLLLRMRARCFRPPSLAFVCAACVSGGSGRMPFVIIRVTMPCRILILYSVVAIEFRNWPTATGPVVGGRPRYGRCQIWHAHQSVIECEWACENRFVMMELLF